MSARLFALCLTGLALTFWAAALAQAIERAPVKPAVCAGLSAAECTIAAQERRP